MHLPLTSGLVAGLTLITLGALTPREAAARLPSQRAS